MEKTTNYVCTKPATVTPLQIPKLKIEKRKVSPVAEKGGNPDGHSCSTCGKSYPELSYLKAHKVVSHGPNAAGLHNNNTNNKTTSSLTALRSYKCDACGKLFNRNSHLDRHRMIHTGEKPFKCKVCDKNFSRNYHLDRHLFTHTGEKPYSCEVCAKAFSRTDKLKKHAMTHISPFHIRKNVR